MPPTPILKGEKGEPRWPDGLVGSLTHTEGYRGAVVGRSPAVRSVGIDAEPHDVLPGGVLTAVSLPQADAGAVFLDRAELVDVGGERERALAFYDQFLARWPGDRREARVRAGRQARRQLGQ